MTLISSRPEPGDSAPVSHVVLASASAELSERITELLRDELTSVDIVSTVQEMEALAGAPDLLILDAATPAMTDQRTVARLRHRWVMMLIAAIGVEGEGTATELFDAGVDYVVEADRDPVYVAASLNAAARRTRAANAMLRRRVGDIVYDRENRRVWCAGTEVEFAPRELAVLDALWSRAGELVHHDSLQDYVWSGIDDGERSNRLEVYISYIRRKLQMSNEVTIQTIRGAGYRLVRKSATDTPWKKKE